MTEALAEDGDPDNPADKRGFCTATLGLVYAHTGVAVAGMEALQGFLSTGCYLLKITCLTVRTCLPAEVTTDILLSDHFWRVGEGAAHCLRAGRLWEISSSQGRWDSLLHYGQKLWVWMAYDAAKWGSQRLLASSQHCKYPFPGRGKQYLSAPCKFQ